jgi:hypothetical protein
MKYANYAVLIALSFMIGCGHAPVATTHSSNTVPSSTTRSSNPAPKPTVKHNYELTFTDIDGKPLSGVHVDYSLGDWDKVVSSSSYTTGYDGKLYGTVVATPKEETLYLGSGYSFPVTYFSYGTGIKYTAKKEGYYSKSDTINRVESGKDNETKTESVMLLRPIDYLNRDFASTVSDIELKTRILSFIDLILLQGLLTDSMLAPQSINIIKFKDNSYLQFKFNNGIVYNSLKSNKYDIGKNIFDEVIRKVLTPLDKLIAGSDLFYGYDLTVIGYSKSFAEKDANKNPIEYRFMIPEDIARQYKNKDISGQQLLDSSIILMDDERVDLKLQ